MLSSVMEDAGPQPAFRPCIVIPCCNDAEHLPALLTQLEPLHLRAFLVDDGSCDATRQKLLALRDRFLWVDVLRLNVNSGKGAAVLAGLLHAAEAGFSHALQMDCDARHDPRDAALLLSAARTSPRALICAVRQTTFLPWTEKSVRFLARSLCFLETRNTHISDPHCGYRVYPIAAVLSLVHEHPLASRTDFDIEVLVRLYWRGIDVVEVPVAFRSDGISVKRSVREDIRLTAAHVRLLMESIWHWKRDSRLPNSQHWSEQKNELEIWGVRLLSLSCRLLGVRSTIRLLWPLSALWVALQPQQKESSRSYLMRLENFAAHKGIVYPKRLSIHRHFFTYGCAIVDRLAAWSDKERASLQVEVDENSQAVLASTGANSGKLILGSHLGVLEACCALSEGNSDTVLHVIVNEDLSENIFASVAKESFSQLHLIRSEDLSAQTLSFLQTRIAAGDWVAIAADRTAEQMSGNEESATAGAPFLGDAALFPIAPYELAAKLACPVVALFALIDECNVIHLHAESFAQRITLPAAIRDQSLQGYVKRYAALLERYVLAAPYNWFNFYDFWARGKK